MATRKRYTKEFKLEAFGLARENGKSAVGGRTIWSALN